MQDSNPYSNNYGDQNLNSANQPSPNMNPNFAEQNNYNSNQAQMPNYSANNPYPQNPNQQPAYNLQNQNNNTPKVHKPNPWKGAFLFILGFILGVGVTVAGFASYLSIAGSQSSQENEASSISTSVENSLDSGTTPTSLRASTQGFPNASTPATGTNLNSSVTTSTLDESFPNLGITSTSTTSSTTTPAPTSSPATSIPTSISTPGNSTN